MRDITVVHKHQDLESIFYTIPDHVNDAVTILQHLNLTKEVLVMGYPMGSIVASSLTGRRGALFYGLLVHVPPYWRNKAFWADTPPKRDGVQNDFVFATMAFGTNYYLR